MTTNTLNRRGFARHIGAFAALAATGSMNWPRVAYAQDFPTKPIRVIVPFAAGGPTDVTARIVTQILQRALGQGAIVENRAGAGGAVGMRYVAQAEPDGHTLLLGTVATLAALPAVQKNAGFDPLKSYAPVARLTDSASVLVVQGDAPYRTVQELVRYAQANPGKLNFSSAGIGNQTHLNGELFKIRTNTRIEHVPYKSGGEMVQAVLAKDAHLTFSAIASVVQHVEGGRLRALAVTTPTRHPRMPNVPTLQEAGVPNFTASFWTGILAPAGTPAPVVARLNTAINAGITAPEVTAQLTAAGSDPTPTTPQDFANFIAAEYQKWVDTVKTAGITAE